MKVHKIRNNGKEITCELSKKRNSKNIRLRVDNSGIVKLSLPYYTPYIIAKKFINENLGWIDKKLHEYEIQNNKYYYLGQNIRLIKKVDANNKSFNYILNNNELIIESNSNLDERYLFVRWLRERAHEYIPPKVKELSLKYNFEYNSIKIKNLNSRWGSCSSKKNLSFNLKLMYFNSNIIDYVIIHELCHLKEMNHSKKFWNLVHEICPNYKEYKKQLNNFIHS